MDLEYGRLNGTLNSATLVDINGRKTVDECMMEAKAVLVLQPIAERDARVQSQGGEWWGNLGMG